MKIDRIDLACFLIALAIGIVGGLLRDPQMTWPSMLLNFVISLRVHRLRIRFSWIERWGNWPSGPPGEGGAPPPCSRSWWSESWGPKT